MTLLVFLGLAKLPSVLAIMLVVAVLLLLVQSLRLRWSQQEAKVIADNLLEQTQLTSLGGMVAGIAHELTTPLSAMSCSVGTQKKAAQMLDAAVAEMSAPGADLVASSAKCERALRAMRTSDEVLDQALIRSSQLVRELRLAGRGDSAAAEPVDVNKLIEGTLILLSHELKTGVEVTLNLGEVKTVPGWPGPLGQVILNLVLNARQALGTAGEITINSAMDGQNVVIRVADDGPGLPTGCTDSLFKAGYTTKSADEGTGLGLFICRKIIDRHGGSIAAANGLSGGAEFMITLPAST